MSEILLTWPDSLAREAKASGLLKPEFIASLLKTELRRRRVNKLFAADLLADLDVPLTDAEIKAEMAEARKVRRKQ